MVNIAKEEGEDEKGFHIYAVLCSRSMSSYLLVSKCIASHRVKFVAHASMIFLLPFLSSSVKIRIFDLEHSL